LHFETLKTADFPFSLYVSSCMALTWVIWS